MQKCCNYNKYSIPSNGISRCTFSKKHFQDDPGHNKYWEPQWFCKHTGSKSSYYSPVNSVLYCILKPRILSGILLIGHYNDLFYFQLYRDKRGYALGVEQDDS